ncbi:hypothetical protein ACFIOY_14840 [Bradyrhizobium sp. TZ2]
MFESVPWLGAAAAKPDQVERPVAVLTREARHAAAVRRSSGCETVPWRDAVVAEPHGSPGAAGRAIAGGAGRAIAGGAGRAIAGGEGRAIAGGAAGRAIAGGAAGRAIAGGEAAPGGGPPGPPLPG